MYYKIKPKLPDKTTYKLITEKEQYASSINDFPESFNVIIIDGSHRHQCALEAIKKLDDAGLIILDNSDWAENISRMLKFGKSYRGGHDRFRADWSFHLDNFIFLF